MHTPRGPGFAALTVAVIGLSALPANANAILHSHTAIATINPQTLSGGLPAHVPEHGHPKAGTTPGSVEAPKGTAVPEVGSILMLGSSLLLVAVFLRRRATRP